MPIQALRHPQLVEQARGDPHQAGKVGVAVEQDGELVTRQPRHGIGLRYRVGDPLGHLLEQLVGQLMAEALVEQLEAIQVDVQQGQAAPVQADALGGLVQTQAEQRPVGKPGQIVVVRQVAQALL
jgi:hypothetical protein